MIAASCFPSTPEPGWKAPSRAAVPTVKPQARAAPKRTITFEHFYLSLQAAVAGAGTAIGPIALVADDLATGALVAPYGLAADGSSYVLMAPAAARESSLFDTTLDWLRAECAKLDAWAG